MITRGMPISRISAAACSGPAPPKAQSVKSRGSRPRSISTERSAPTMLLSAMRTIAIAVSAVDRPSRSATAATARSAESACSPMRPPRK